MIILENESLRVAISDGRGARVEEFFDKKNKKNWVWKPSKKDNENGALGLSEGFDDNWSGGFEEVFPNDAPTVVENYKLVDHGEVWRRNWEVDGSTTSKRASFFIRCETYPMVFRKTYTLSDSEALLKIDFEVESLASRPLPFMFKWHPALAIDPGDEFELPYGERTEVAPGFGNIFVNHESLNVAMEKGDGREFIRLSEFEEGKVSVRSKNSNSKLTMEFSRIDFPHLWLFQSYGGFMGHYVSMIEPINAHHYDLGEMFKEGKAEMIPQFGKRHFSLRLKVSGR